jgi:UDP-N-acetylglucosamine 2-epimerase (non-hydrolysing)
MLEPFGFFDFVHLEQNSFMAVSDSGTVQEEMCLFKIPTVTIRDTTERPETVWCGSNIVTGLEKDNILAGYNRMKVANRDWVIPVEYDRENVSDVVVNILLSN